MATPLLLYLLDEASSGTGPAALLDTSAGTPLNLTITYATSAWSNIASGDGLTFNGACGAVSAALNGTKVASAMAGSKTGTWEVRCNMSSGSTTETMAYFGTDTGGTDLLFFANDFGSLTIQYAGAFVGSFAVAATGLHTYHLVADTTQAVAADRLKLYIDGVQQTLTGASFPAQNLAIDNGATDYSHNLITLGTAGTINNASPVGGTVYYAALYSTALDQTTITANVAALAANNDANPNVVFPIITVQPQSQRVPEGATPTFNVTANGTGTLHYLWKVNGGSVGADQNSYTWPTPVTFADNFSTVTVDVTDDIGTTVSSTAILSVYEIPRVAWLRA